MIRHTLEQIRATGSTFVADLAADPQVAALAAAAVALVLLAVAGWACGRARRRRERRALATELEKLREDQRRTAALAVRAARRLRRAEDELNRLAARLDSLSLHGPASVNPQAYDQAIRLVRRGADAARLVNDLGFARGEAELVARLHGRRRVG